MEERMDEEQKKAEMAWNWNYTGHANHNPAVSLTEAYMTCAIYHTFQLVRIHFISKLWISSCYMLLPTISNVFF